MNVFPSCVLRPGQEEATLGLVFWHPFILPLLFGWSVVSLTAMSWQGTYVCLSFGSATAKSSPGLSVPLTATSKRTSSAGTAMSL